MILDARDLPPDHVVDGGVVVIGAGAAGIALACELEGSGLDVVVLESGGLRPDIDHTRLNQGRSVGLQTPPLESTRLRYFGGTTGHWTGQCAPLDPIDFEARDWVPLSGWPITRTQLDPYYARATSYVGLGPMVGFDTSHVLVSSGGRELGVGGPFETIAYQSSPPTRFGSAYRGRLERAPDVRVYLHANVVEFELDDGGNRVDSVRCGTEGSHRIRVRGGRFVLAAGGIENPRILLASNSRRPAGLGNESDVVGRYFMDHLSVAEAGELHFGRPDTVDSDFYGFWTIGESTGRGALRPTDELLRSERLLNAGLLLWPTPVNEAFRREERGQGVEAFVSLAQALSSVEVPSDAWEKTCLAVADRREVARFVLRRLQRTVASPGGTLDAGIQMECEQVPNPSSRVTLTREVDAFGVPRVQLDWRITTQDLASVRTLLRRLGERVGSVGLGRYRAEFDLESGEPEFRTSYHHMGTTRMGLDPRTSVVDADCRVHSVANLFAAGSSVFPTGGRSNPTFTIVALAIRLADHLRTGGTA